MVKFNKEMVDLLSKVKKHLRDKHQMAISFADPDVLDKLVALRDLPDPLLQGMLRYLMAMAGPEWTARLDDPHSATAQASPADQPASTSVG